MILRDKTNFMELEIKYNPSYWDGLMGTAWWYTAGWIMKSNLGKNKEEVDG